MSSGVGFTITGVPEMQSALKRFASEIAGPIAKKAIKQSMDAAQNKATSTVHVVSGDLRNSIRSTADSDSKGRMGATVEYGRAEERRGGPHKFIEPAYEQEKNAFPQTYMKLAKAALSAR